MIPRLRGRAQTLEVACAVDVERSATSLHAHVELEGVEVEPGDSVLVLDAPVDLEYGERRICRRRATLRPAGRLRRAWTRLLAPLELSELYEVGFSPRRTP